MSPTRRTVLKGLGAGAAVAAGGAVGWWALAGDDSEPAPGSTTAPPPPVSSLGDALVAVGGRYLEAFPEEADRTLLLDALPPLDGEVPADPAQALGVLGPLVADDAASGRTITLDGWVLSRTECRAAALYAL